MARIRKFSAYQNLERPYTRISKFSKKHYVRGGFPSIKIVKFDMGTQQKTYDTTLLLTTRASMNVRHNAIEAGRMTTNRMLEKTLGKEYHLRVKIYPFHILRENPLASGAGADRMSTGMQKSYGKAISAAARVKEGQVLMELRVNKDKARFGREALERGSSKFPCPCKVITLA